MKLEIVLLLTYVMYYTIRILTCQCISMIFALGFACYKPARITNKLSFHNVYAIIVRNK